MTTFLDDTLKGSTRNLSQINHKDIASFNFRLLNSARSILFILDTPNRLSCLRRQGIITHLTAFARSQPICSRTQAPTVHRFAGYRLFTVRKCIAPYTDHRIINLPVDFRSVLIRSSAIHQSHGGSFLVLPA